jgi:hypothetical protein
MQATNASLSELATELQKADLALSLGLSRREERKWQTYRRNLLAEIERRDPVKHIAATMTDAELLAALAE